MGRYTTQSSLTLIGEGVSEFPDESDNGQFTSRERRIYLNGFTDGFACGAWQAFYRGILIGALGATALTVGILLYVRVSG